MFPHHPSSGFSRTYPLRFLVRRQDPRLDFQDCGGVYSRHVRHSHMCRARIRMDSIRRTRKYGKPSSQGDSQRMPGTCVDHHRDSVGFGAHRQEPAVATGRPGRVCSRPHVDFQGFHPRLCSRYTAIPKRHAPRGRLDYGSFHQCQRHRDGRHAHGSESTELRQYHGDAATLYAGQHLVSELAQYV